MKEQEYYLAICKLIMMDGSSRMRWKSHVRFKGGENSKESTYPNHRSLLIRKKMYWGWRLPSAARLKEEVFSFNPNSQ